MRDKCTIVHHCKFVDLHPVPITSIDHEPNLNLLAVSKSNGIIQLWSTHNSSCSNLMNIYPTANDNSIFKIRFFTPRNKENRRSLVVFDTSKGLSLISLSSFKRTKIDSHGGKIHCGDVNNALNVAVIGCQDGCVKVFDIEPSLFYRHSISVSTNEITSLCWNFSPLTPKIAVGSADGSISIWNIFEKKNLMAMSFDSSPSSTTKNIILSMEWLKSNEIVSGDSSGNTAIWDSIGGVQIASFRLHKGPILCLERNKRIVYSTGKDSRIIPFFRGAKNTWSKGTPFRPQSRGLRSLRTVHNKLFCGGEDGNLVVVNLSNVMKKSAAFATKDLAFKDWIELDANYAMKKNVSVARSAEILMAETSEGLEFWKLSGEREVKLAKLETEGIVKCCAISDAGDVVFFCDDSGPHLLSSSFIQEIEFGVKEMNLNQCCDAVILNSVIYTLSLDRKELIKTDMKTKESKKMVKVESKQFDFITSFIVQKGSSESEGTSHVIITSLFSGKVKIFSNSDKIASFEVPNKPLAMCLDCDKKILLTLSAENELAGFNLDNGKRLIYFLKYSQRIKHILTKFGSYFNDIKCHNSLSNVFYICSPKIVVRIDIELPPPPPQSESSDLRMDSMIFSENDDGDFNVSNLSKVNHFNPLKMDVMNDGSLVIVEQDHKAINDSLPKVKYPKTFGMGI